MIAVVGLSVNGNDGNLMLFCIVNRVFRSALSAVKDSDHAGGVIDHPFVAVLKAGAVIGGAEILNEIGGV